MITRPIVLPPEDRGWAAVAHLSGLAGYVVPLGGIIVPIVIWRLGRRSPFVSTIATQAVRLNLAVYGTLLLAGLVFLALTASGEGGAGVVNPESSLLPIVGIGLFLLGLTVLVLVSLAAIVLPIVGAVRAGQGEYYRYPVVGRSPV